MHVWALWRLVVVGLIALPFLVAAVVVGFRRSHADGSTPGAIADDAGASPEIAGPSAWGRDVDARVNVPRVDTASVDRRAA